MRRGSGKGRRLAAYPINTEIPQLQGSYSIAACLKLWILQIDVVLGLPPTSILNFHPRIPPFMSLLRMPRLLAVNKLMPTAISRTAAFAGTGAKHHTHTHFISSTSPFAHSNLPSRRANLRHRTRNRTPLHPQCRKCAFAPSAARSRHRSRVQLQDACFGRCGP